MLMKDQSSHMAKVVCGRADGCIGSLRTASSRACFSLMNSCSDFPQDSATQARCIRGASSASGTSG